MVLGVSECAQGCCLKVKVVPKAGRCGMLAPKGPDDPNWQVRLTAPAVDGKANEALLEFLAKLFKLRRRQLVIKLGEKSRHKVILLEGLTLAEVEKSLETI